MLLALTEEISQTRVSVAWGKCSLGVLSISFITAANDLENAKLVLSNLAVAY